MRDLDIRFEDVVGVIAIALLFAAGLWLAYGVGLPTVEGL